METLSSQNKDTLRIKELLLSILAKDEDIGMLIFNIVLKLANPHPEKVLEFKHTNKKSRNEYLSKMLDIKRRRVKTIKTIKKIRQLIDKNNLIERKLNVALKDLLDKL